MSPDDQRHGTLRGHSAGCREACCRRAYALYEKKRRLNSIQGTPLAVPAIGAQRRIQALLVLGWTTTDIAKDAGWSHRNRVGQILKGQKGRPCRWVERATHDTIARIYEARCMSVPEMTPTRRRYQARAIRLGYTPPLSWDDIDNDPHPIGLVDEFRGFDDVEPVVVERLLLGERVDSTRAEKEEALRRWLADGKSQAELCRIHGWKQGRYVSKEAA